MTPHLHRVHILAAATLMILGAGVPEAARAQSVLYVDNDRVSIGKSSPQAPLEVDAAGSTVGTGNSVVLVKNTGPVAFQLDDTDTAGFWNFAVLAGEGEFRISKSGTGTTELALNTSGDLTIAGDIYTDNCAPCVSDYVFKPDYHLMPLAELDSYIKDNGHLPNVLSEAEYRQRGGVALHEMQVKLLEKIEELTLYTLEQQKRIDALTLEQEKLTKQLVASREDGASHEGDGH